MKRIACIVFLIAGILPCASIVSAESISEPSITALVQDVKSAVRQAQARYDSGNVTGAADLARKILDKYPNNVDAKAILDKCIATEREDYRVAVESMSVSKLESFKEKYPNSEFSDDVSKRIADLPLWLEAKGKNTIESYNHYLSESSHKFFKQDADAAIEEITVKQAYDTAVATNTIKAFELFRSSYPGSKYDKDASNKIARLLADKFTSKSTYSDKSNALSYAKNELTRDYVNNKYNKATQKNYASGTSKSYSSNSSNKSNTTSYSTSSQNTYRSLSSLSNTPGSIRFGINVFGDLGVYNSGSSSNVYSAYPYSIGVGGHVRFGDQRWALNFVTGLNVMFTKSNIKLNDPEHYIISDDVIREKVTSVAIPLELRWNMIRSESFGTFIGAGFVYGYPATYAAKAMFGFSWLHGDWYIQYIKYFKGPYKELNGFTPFMGMGVTFYL